MQLCNKGRQSQLQPHTPKAKLWGSVPSAFLLCILLWALLMSSCVYARYSSTMYSLPWKQIPTDTFLNLVMDGVCVSPSNSYVEALTPKVAVFGDRAGEV